MYDACVEAEHSIEIEQFLFYNDRIGNKFVDLLIHKAKEGVRVRLLVDSAGSFGYFGAALEKRLLRGGVDLLFFNPISIWQWRASPIWLLRDHRKLLIVDKKVGFIGGVGIADKLEGWRDTHVRFVGSVVHELQEAFDHMWWIAVRNKFVRYKKPRPTVDGFTVVTNAPHRRQRFIYRTLIEAVRNAKKYVYLTSPYFVPDYKFFRVLRLAAKRGVDVRVLLPNKSDHPLVDQASDWHYSRAFAAGIRIFEYHGMLHTKSLVIDGDWSTMGSSNMDNLSSFINYEINVISTDRRFTEELKMHFLMDSSPEKAEEVDPRTWHNRSLWKQFKELFAAPFGRFF